MCAGVPKLMDLPDAYRYYHAHESRVCENIFFFLMSQQIRFHRKTLCVLLTKVKVPLIGKNVITSGKYTLNH